MWTSSRRSSRPRSGSRAPRRADLGSLTPEEVAGLTWSVQERGDGDTSWTYVDPAQGGLTTVVSASSDSDDLRAVVAAVSEALAG